MKLRRSPSGYAEASRRGRSTDSTWRSTLLGASPVISRYCAVSCAARNHAWPTRVQRSLSSRQRGDVRRNRECVILSRRSSPIVFLNTSPSRGNAGNCLAADYHSLPASIDTARSKASRQLIRLKHGSPAGGGGASMIETREIALFLEKVSKTSAATGNCSSMSRNGGGNGDDRRRNAVSDHVAGRIDRACRAAGPTSPSTTIGAASRWRIAPSRSERSKMRRASRCGVPCRHAGNEAETHSMARHRLLVMAASSCAAAARGER